MAKTLDRRKQILKAAVDVFAERGFHRTRVSDIAKKADVAYGLIYHYFESKDDVLDSVFRDNWSIFLKVLKDLRDDQSKSVVERLGVVIDSLLEALYVAPSVVQVIIQEVSRSDRFVEKEKYEAFQEAFDAVQSMIEQGQSSSEIRKDVNAEIAPFILFGALETVCTGTTLKLISCDDDEQRRQLKETVRSMLLSGLIHEKGMDNDTI
ncbi:MAG: TetR/AcrR family transcriptional regulator [Myxococcota bacterium]|nr:TetR/AcrR family transcriptional regulator [Myxococcota bacterium]